MDLGRPDKDSLPILPFSRYLVPDTLVALVPFSVTFLVSSLFLSLLFGFPFLSTFRGPFIFSPSGGSRRA